MAKHPKMIVGGIVGSEFSVLLDPRTNIGLENRRLVEIEGYDDVAVALRNVATNDPFVIERVISTEEYERLDSYKLIYGGAPVIRKLGKFQAI